MMDEESLSSRTGARLPGPSMEADKVTFFHRGRCGKGRGGLPAERPGEGFLSRPGQLQP